MLKIITFIAAICAFCANAEVVTINTINEVVPFFNSADEETLVILDCDDTITEPVDWVFKFASREYLVRLVHASLEAHHLPRNKCSTREEVYSLFHHIITRSAKNTLLNREWPAFISTLQKRGVKVILLSSCTGGSIQETSSVPQWRYEELRRHGVDFSASWPGCKKIIFPLDGDMSGKKPDKQTFAVFDRGMLLCPSKTKGRVLLAFLDRMPKHKFKKIVFFDDSIRNIKDVERAVEEIGLNYIGVEYTYARTRTLPPVDLDQVQEQIDLLVWEGQWISDEEMLLRRQAKDRRLPPLGKNFTKGIEHSPQ
jgi:hypothetical protein